ncbi:hypothetical protein BC829DRAFT_448116 [Chytridium lagenaria]|nr:hypothetical protein BC829DRAFT_448116 [Chytridium lagenaria]
MHLTASSPSTLLFIAITTAFLLALWPPSIRYRWRLLSNRLSTACQACDVNNLARVLGPAIAVCPGAEITTLQGRLADLKATLDAACLA